jgi:hypothetical protein
MIAEILLCLFIAYLVFWFLEVSIMKVKGYWLDAGFSGRGSYNPKWRCKQRVRKDIPSRFVPF